MTIKEMEEATGLSRSNIRFYEKEKLIDPKRNEKNGYRIYSEEDAQCVKKIAYLRTLGVSVEELQKIIHGDISLEQVLKLLDTQLDKELVQLQHAKQLCHRMLTEQTLTFQNLEPDKYMREAENCWEENSSVLKKDSVSFIHLWGSQIVWGILTLLCLITAVVGYRLLPGPLPIQWSSGAVSSSVDKMFIFAYPLICILIRVGIRPFIWRWLCLHMSGMSSDGVTNYITNFFCFVLWSVELFTIVFVLGFVDNIVVLLVADGLVFLGLFVWASVKN